MPMTFYAGPEGSEWIEVAVDDPGDGWYQATVLASSSRPVVVAGPMMGALVDQVLAVATGTPPPRTPTALQPLVEALDQTRAVELLPVVVRALSLAAAGEDRYDRTWPSEGLDVEPLCANCNQGTGYAQTVTISEWCMHHGHRPFGQPGGAWQA